MAERHGFELVRQFSVATPTHHAGNFLQCQIPDCAIYYEETHTHTHRHTYVVTYCGVPGGRDQVDAIDQTTDEQLLHVAGT